MVKWAWHKMCHFNYFYVNSTGVLSTLTLLCGLHHHPSPELFIIPNLIQSPLNTNSPCPFLPTVDTFFLLSLSSALLFILPIFGFKMGSLALPFLVVCCLCVCVCVSERERRGRERGERWTKGLLRSLAPPVCMPEPSLNPLACFLI